MNCSHHEQLPAVAVCSTCGRALCETCSIQWEGKTVCKHCLEARASAGRKPDAERMRKSPLLAGLLSLLPGAGQVYVGYYASGFTNILVVCGIITLLSQNSLKGWEPFLATFLSFYWVFSVIDAVRRARLYNEFMAGERPERMPTDSPLIGGILLLVLGAILTLHFTLGISVEFVETIWPLAVLAGGIYLVAKYYRTRRELAESRVWAEGQAAATGRSTAGYASEAGNEARFAEGGARSSGPDKD